MVKQNESQSVTRVKILEAATDEFAQKGLAGARVDNIARQAGVNKAMIYYHFSSKEDLYRVMIESQVAKIGAALSSAVEPSAGLESSLLNLSRTYHSILGSDRRFPLIALHEMANGGQVLKEAMLRSIRQPDLPAKMREKVNEGIAAGMFRPVDARQAMISFVGMNLFYLLMAPFVALMLEIEDAEEFRRKRPEQIVDLFLRGLEVR